MSLLSLRIRKLLNRSILNRLLLSFFVIVLAPTLIISCFSYFKLVDSEKTSYDKDNTEILKTMDKILHIYFQDFERLTYNSFLSKDIQSILKSNGNDASIKLRNQWKFSDFATNLMGNRKDVEGIYLIDRNKFTYYIASQSDIKIGHDLTSEPWFSPISKSNGELVIIGSHMQDYNSKPSKGYVISAARMIRDLDYGETIGYILVEIKPDVFYNMFQDIDKNERNIVIVDQNSNIVFDQDESKIMKKYDSVYDYVAISSEENGIHSGRDNGNYVVSVYDKSLGWTFIESIPMERLLTKINGITYPLMYIFISCLITFFLISFYISKSITQPIKLLENSMRKVRTGDLKQKVIVNCGGEVESLALNFNTMVEEIQELISKVYETQLKELDSQFKALQAQINPHFLYNTLDSIDSLAQIKGEEEISEMIRSLSRMFRYTVKQDNGLVPLRDEINHVKDYFLLQAVRYNDKFSIVYEIPEDLINVKVIKLILQPIVENAINHGFGKSLKKGRISISAAQNSGHLLLTVSDTGTGIDSNKLDKLNEQLENDFNGIAAIDKKSDSIGIFNIHARIRLYHGSDYGLKLDSMKGKGTNVQVMLPLLEEE